MAKLWGKEITVDEQISLLEDFSSYLEVSMLVTIEKFKSIIILQKMGWLNDARDFLVKTLPEVCDEVGGYLVKSRLMNPPNWKIFLKDRLEIAKEAGQAIYSYHEKCFQICASQYQQQYQATYEQELAKQDGLGFGIISSSLAAHLVYAAQSASKERQNEKKASEAADKIMHSSLGPVEKAGKMTIAFYHEKFDPFVVEFLIGFYSDIERLIYDGLEIDKEVLDNNKTLSDNELSDITEDNHRERITTSLSIYPFNGDAMFWAVRYDDAGNELIEFCSNNLLLLPKYLVSFEQSAIAYLKKQKEKADLYNRDPLTEDIIQLLQRIRAFLTDERMYGASTYDNIVQEVYGEKIDFTYHKFETLVKIKKTPSSLSSYAKEHKIINVSSNDFETLQKYNSIFGTSKIREIFSVIPNEVEAFTTMLSVLSAELREEHEKHQEAERQRKQRERERAEQERKAEEQRQAELKRQQELEKAKTIKRIAIIVPLIIIGIVLLVFLSNKIEYNNQVKQYCTFETAITKTSSEYDCIYALESLAYEYKELGDDIRADWRSYKDDEAKTQEKLLLELENKFDELALQIIEQSSANLKYSSNELIKTLKEDGYLIYCVGERHSKGDYEYAFDSYLFFFSKTYIYDCTYYIIETLYPETFTKGIKERLVSIGESRGSYEYEQENLNKVLKYIDSMPNGRTPYLNEIETVKQKLKDKLNNK